VRIVYSDVAFHHVVEDPVVVCLGDLFTGSVGYCEPDFAAPVIGESRQVYFGSHIRSLRSCPLGYEHSIGAIIQRGNANGFRHFEPRVPIEASVDVEVSAEGSNFECRGVVAHYG